MQYVFLMNYNIKIYLLQPTSFPTRNRKKITTQENDQFLFVILFSSGIKGDNGLNYCICNSR